MEHGIFYNMVRVTVHPERICANWRLLDERGGNGCAVIKSDAYGHGIEVVGRALRAAGARNMAVGTVEEGAVLLDALAAPGEGGGGGADGADAQDVRVISLLGPQCAEDHAEAVARSMVCFVGRDEQLKALSAEGLRQGRPALAAIKFDTGMSRLGYAPDEAARVAGVLDGLPGVRAVLAASHLAVADEDGGEEFVRVQAERFGAAVGALRAAGHPVEATLANTAALLAYPWTRLDMQRPGIGLYGPNPLAGTDLARLGEGLLPAMDVRAPVLQVHDVRAGETVSYGRTFRAERDMRVAVLGAGYADCYGRALSGRAQVVVRGVRAPVLGRVCMQMCVADVSDAPGAAAGDDAWLLGGPDAAAVTPEELAGWWGTITYETFCLLGLNRREYAEA